MAAEMTLLDCGWDMNRFWRWEHRTLAGLARLKPLVMLVLVFGAISVLGWVEGVRASAAEPNQTPSIAGVCEGAGRAAASESRAVSGPFECAMEVAQNAAAPRPSATPSAVGPSSALDVIMTAPATAEVWIDGNEVGDTSRQTTGISPGSHYVKISAEGFVAVARVLEFVAGVPTVWRGVTLVAKPASILVSMLRPEEAEVLVDGKSVGAAGTQIEGIKQGTHLLVVQRAGFESHRETITVEPGELLRISNVILERLSAELMVEMVEPYQANVLIDGIKQGTSGTEIPGLVPGPTEVVVEADGYESKTIRVELVANETKTIRGVTLKPMPATLAVECNAMGAEVVVDGKVLGKTTGGIDNFEVPAASRQIVVRRPGYLDFRKWLRLDPGRSLPVEVELSTQDDAPRVAAQPRTKRIAVGDGFVCGITREGRVSCRGGRDFPCESCGESGNAVTLVPNVRDAVDISSGWRHSCAVTKQGRVRCWGANNHGQLGNGNRRPVRGSTEVRGISTAVQVDVSTHRWIMFFEYGDPDNYNTTCAVLRDGKVVCWGDNAYGQLGDGSTRPSLTPVRVRGLEKAVAVSVGETGACAVTEDGLVHCWGDALDSANGSPVDAHGNAVWAKAPVQVRGISSAVQVAVGTGFSCALLRDKSVACWGSDWAGALGDGPDTASGSVVKVAGLENAISISAGDYHVCAQTADGRVACWGSNDVGQVNGVIPESMKECSYDANIGGCEDSAALVHVHVPERLPNYFGVQELAAGVRDTCILSNNSQLSCWGATEQLGLSLF